ncbi:hypothetical protein ACFRMQ_39690, partial [Kitasatospora sp. NPDC056783]
EVWRGASRYDPRCGEVMAWVMTIAPIPPGGRGAGRGPAALGVDDVSQTSGISHNPTPGGPPPAPADGRSAVWLLG